MIGLDRHGSNPVELDESVCLILQLLAVLFQVRIVNSLQASEAFLCQLAMSDLLAGSCRAPTAGNKFHTGFPPGQPKTCGHESYNPGKNRSGGSQKIIKILCP